MRSSVAEVDSYPSQALVVEVAFSQPEGLHRYGAVRAPLSDPAPTTGPAC